MPFFERGGVRLRYELDGHGFPVLLLAPGGLRSSVDRWAQAPWNPVDDLRDGFCTIAMDQRNAGQSTGPIAADHGWQTYTDDQLALLDHLGVGRFAVQGMCIGCAFALRLAEAAPERVAAAVLMQPIGLDGNEEAFRAVFDGWADEQRPRRPDVREEVWAAVRERVFGGDFVFSVSREAVARIRAPLLVLRGDDIHHPSAISREVAALAPNAALIEDWKGAAAEGARQRVRSFLEQHARP